MLKSTWQQIKTKEFKVLISIKSQSAKVAAMVKLNDYFWGFVDGYTDKNTICFQSKTFL